MKSCVIYLLILLLCSSSSMFAQNQIATPEKQAKKLQAGQEAKARADVQRRAVGNQSTVKIVLRDKTEVKGHISQIDADSFQVTDKKSGRARTIAFADVEMVRGPGLSRAAKIAIGVGAAGILVGIAAATLPKD